MIPLGAIPSYYLTPLYHIMIQLGAIPSYYLTPLYHIMLSHGAIPSYYLTPLYHIMIPLGAIPKIYLFRKIKVILLFFGIVSLILENNNINFYWKTKNKYIIINFSKYFMFLDRSLSLSTIYFII